jgi:hypothetical protein
MSRAVHSRTCETLDHEHLVAIGEHGGFDRGEVRHGQERYVARTAEALRAHLQLGGRLLAAHVEYARPAACERVADLQDKGRLPDAGFAAQQDERAADETATQHPVELAHPRREPSVVARLHLR